MGDFDFCSVNFTSMSRAISLTPGFSPVSADWGGQNRFNGFLRAGKPLKRLPHIAPSTTRLKPGVNESHLNGRLTRQILKAKEL